MTTDETAIQDLVARFDDAVNRRDIDEFKTLWAEDGVWEIGDPMPLRVVGAGAIAETWSGMIAGTDWLFRGSFAGVVAFDGDKGTGRWPCIETGTFSDGRGYDNRAFYDDVYARIDGNWRFQRRHYTYLWLSNDKLPGAPVRLAQGPDEESAS
jgi:ketosteroid isomerase-like protein